VMRGSMPAADEGQLAAVIDALGPLPRVTDLRASAVADVVAHDKKIVNGRLHFVLSAGIGRTRIVNDVTRAELVDVARAIGCRA